MGFLLALATSDENTQVKLIFGDGSTVIKTVAEVVEQDLDFANFELV